MNITIHVLNVNNYFPQLMKKTMPTIEAWAERMGGDVNVISKRHYSDEWPVEYEKLWGTYHSGKGDNRWNLLLDGDMLISKDMYNPVYDKNDNMRFPGGIYTLDSYSAKSQLRTYDNRFFQRDTRDIGISACCVLASSWCHEIFKPLDDDITWEQAKKNLTHLDRNIDEFCLSENNARGKFYYESILRKLEDYSLIEHLGIYGRSKEKVLRLADEWYEKNWE